MKKLKWLGLCWLASAAIFSAPVLAALPPLLEEAFAAMSSHVDWAYSKETSGLGTVTVERFDPLKPAATRWTLSAVGGKPPSAQALEEYGKAQRPASSEQDFSRLRRKVRDDTVKLIEESDLYALYTFKPAAAPAPAGEEKDSQAMQAVQEQLQGKLRVRKGRRPYIESLELFNGEPFTVKGVMRVQKFVTTLRFAPLQPDGPVFCIANEMTMEVKALLIKLPRQEMRMTYSNFELRKS